MTGSWPALQVVSAPIAPVAHGRQVSVGGLVPLGAGVTIGTEGDVRVAAAVQKQHCRIEPKDGITRLWHYGSLFRTSVNGQPRLEATLQHRDLIALAGGTMFRLLEHEDIAASDAALERDIEQQPDDDDRLRVWCDYLLEQQDPLGDRLLAARRGEPLQHEPWLDTWAAHFVAGRLSVEWKLGLAHRVVVREPSLSFASLAQGLERLFALRVMRFLTEVRLELATERLFDPTAIGQLATVRWPSQVKSLHLGDVPVSEWGWVEAQHAALELRLQRNIGVGQFIDAEIEVLRAGGGHQHRAGERVEVTDQLLLGRSGLSTQTGLILGGSYLLRREGSRFILDQIVTGAEVMRVNGFQVQRFPLCDGDLLELGPDFTARFVLRRP